MSRIETKRPLQPLDECRPIGRFALGLIHGWLPESGLQWVTPAGCHLSQSPVRPAFAGAGLIPNRLSVVSRTGQARHTKPRPTRASLHLPGAYRRREPGTMGPFTGTRTRRPTTCHAAYSIRHPRRQKHKARHTPIEWKRTSDPRHDPADGAFILPPW